ncbi:hypothetical protein Esti_005312 [Eimeria stiedai]
MGAPVRGSFLCLFLALCLQLKGGLSPFSSISFLQLTNMTLLSQSTKNIFSWAAVVILGCAAPIGLAVLQVASQDVHAEALAVHHAAEKHRQRLRAQKRMQEQQEAPPVRGLAFLVAEAVLRSPACRLPCRAVEASNCGVQTPQEENFNRCCHFDVHKAAGINIQGVPSREEKHYFRKRKELNKVQKGKKTQTDHPPLRLLKGQLEISSSSSSSNSKQQQQQQKQQQQEEEEEGSAHEGLRAAPAACFHEGPLGASLRQTGAPPGGYKGRVCRIPNPQKRLPISNSSNSSSSRFACSLFHTSSSSSSLLGLRELMEHEEASCDDSRHVRAPKTSSANQGPLGPPLPLSTKQEEGPLPTMTLDESAAFAAAAAVQRKLQRLQQPKAPPRRRRTLPATAAAAAPAATAAAAAAAASYSSELRLLQPAAVVLAALRAATNNVRNEALWKGLSRRLSLLAPHLSPHQLTVALHATARIKYRDARLVDTFAPLIIKQIDDFGVKNIALVLNALRKLEVPKTDLIEILVNQFCFLLREATAQDWALVSNCLSFFYIYHSRFWRGLLQQGLPRIFSHLEPQHAVIITAALARLDLRDGSCLLQLSKIIKKHAATLQQQQIAVASAALAKLLFVHPRVTAALHQAAHKLLDQARLLLPECLFDNQSLCLLLHSAVCFTGASQGVRSSKAASCCFCRRLLRPAARDKPQSRKSHIVVLLLLLRCGAAVALSATVVHATAAAGAAATPLTDSVSVPLVAGWCCCFSSYQLVPRDFGAAAGRAAAAAVVVAAVVVAAVGVSVQLLVFFEAWFAGPHSYYLETSRLTAYALLQKRLLEVQGYKVLLLPHMEWSELKDSAEKRKYLWAFGRLAAASLQQEATTHFVRLPCCCCYCCCCIAAAAAVLLLLVAAAAGIVAAAHVAAAELLLVQLLIAVAAAAAVAHSSSSSSRQQQEQQKRQQQEEERHGDEGEDCLKETIADEGDAFAMEAQEVLGEADGGNEETSTRTWCFETSPWEVRPHDRPQRPPPPYRSRWETISQKGDPSKLRRRRPHSTWLSLIKRKSSWEMILLRGSIYVGDDTTGRWSWETISMRDDSGGRRLEHETIPIRHDPRVKRSQ